MASISITTGSGAMSGSAVKGQASDNTIAGLKQKLIALNKDLRDALGEPTEAGMQKAKAIQMQIQLTQAKLEQMIQQQAEKAESKQRLPMEATATLHPSRHSGIDVFV